MHQIRLHLFHYTLGVLLLWLTSATPLVYAQGSTTLHTLRLQGTGLSWVQVVVDGAITFNGFLQPGETREWQGAQMTVHVASAAEVTATFDGANAQVIVDEAHPSVTLHWPIKRTLIPEATPTTAGASRAPAYYVIQPGDTLAVIAERFAIDLNVLLTANAITDPNRIYAGAQLVIPGSDGALPDPTQIPLIMPAAVTTTLPIRGSVVERLTTTARTALAASPYHKTTWLTYYGRPGVPVMGILGEHDVAPLTTLLKQQIKAYDLANGTELGVQGAFHLVYGMATKAPGADASHLAFLTNEVVESYIQAAAAEGLAVILDIQIGALSSVDALAYGLPWLTYENVHLALDPEFAMAHQGQAWPGDPIGFVTAAQINEAQAAMQSYLADNDLAGERILLIHQFLDDMIVKKADLDWRYDRIALTISADGWGGPWGKISKYNAFIDEATHFSAFKLFYRWDQPLMTPREALGVDGFGEQGYIEVTPNLVIYQ